MVWKIKNKLVWIWNKIIDYIIIFYKRTFIMYDFFYKRFALKPQVMSVDETLNLIIDNKLSVCRYGDGEFKLIQGRDISFQSYSDDLKERLRKILMVNDSGFLVCIPDIFKKLDLYIDEPSEYWKLHVSKYRSKWNQILNSDCIYGNAFISRCYYQYKRKLNCEYYFDLFKKIWNDREVIIIEGKKSRLGIGNDLFDNTKQINRILAPEINAFSEYERILESAKRQEKDKLILLALGPTATVLAYDLYLEGYQVIDIGHIDVEYEWFLKGAVSKMPIENKFVCEAGFGNGVGACLDEKYLKQIIIDI
ncbi:SP_1767 family glycosyltransferase [Turicibacter sanguinis]|uniref:SP_1767 family glycosyltransferase n=1 Tax=Turicibacter sanguinis TaxID=154288 RepID=UPI0018AC6312|nr:SP_1767 family glycosyltransferase [Turicibacter sanguinis]MDB8558409.1 SP_1767 family glycosyltransferase [Turicibacter sanguinis]MDB8561205.1 SP_1767 family glycosyltransferase [Turicibacter sanguinis]